MVLGEFLKGVEEASYLLRVNAGNNFLDTGGHGIVLVSGNTVRIGHVTMNADLDGVIDEPKLQYRRTDEFSKYYRTGHFMVGGVTIDVTCTFVSNKCQCCSCNA